MRVNPAKTQLLCTSTAINSEVCSFIMIDGKRVENGDSLKTVGFTFGRRPGATEHVKQLRRKFGARAGILRHLKKLQIPQETIVSVYCSFIRPVFEYAASSFHSILTTDQAEQLERLQRVCLKIIFGFKTSYSCCLELANIECLDTRRENQLKKFTAKAFESECFGKRWFDAREKSRYSLRKEHGVVEEFANRDRLRNALLFRMRRIINNGY